MVHDGNTISVHRPDFYAKRFTDFMGKTVFQKIPSREYPPDTIPALCGARPWHRSCAYGTARAAAAAPRAAVAASAPASSVLCRCYSAAALSPPRCLPQGREWGGAARSLHCSVVSAGS